MNFSNFFISRPIFATVLAIILTLVGAMAMRILPIEQYPSVVPPTVSVQAQFPGADAETVAQTVAAPLAEAINGVEDMLYMTSNSADNGLMSLSVAFNIGTDGDINTINVNNRVQGALSQLPEAVQSQGVTVRLRSDSILMLVALTSPSGDYNNVYMQNYATLNILDELRQVPGVGNAEVLGGGEFAMRIWMDPDKLAQYDLTPSEVASAIRAQNTEIPAGNLAATPQSEPRAYTYTITAGGRLSSPDDFRNIFLRTNADGSSLRLEDVARIELGASFYGVDARLNGATMTPIIINQQPGANALETANSVRATMEDLAERFPPGLEYVTPYDTTLFIDASVETVLKTFIEAFLIVIVILFIFLQNWRFTVIAMSVVPVSVIGTFAGFYLFDFSINLLTLFALVLSIGIVVDDAILVVENVERVLSEEDDISVRDATIRAMKEVGGPVIATSLIMAAVFVPVAFMGGFTGQIYQQFAITVAISVALSALMALTFTPALSAIFIKHNLHKTRQSAFKRAITTPLRLFDRFFAGFTALYMWFVKKLVRFWVLALALTVAVGAGSYWLYANTPSTLVPETDQGIVLVSVSLPDAASLDRTQNYMAELSAAIEDIPGVQYSSAVAGYDILSSAVNTARGIMFVNMKPWAERELTANELVGRIMQLGASIDGGSAMAFNVPPIMGLSTTGGFTGYLQSFDGASTRELYEASLKIMQAANQHPVLNRVFSTFNVNVPSYRAEIDQQKALSYGVALENINSALANTFGNGFVNYFSYQNRNFQVYLQNEDEFRKTPEDVNNVYVRGGNGERIPLSEFVTLERQTGPAVVSRFGVYAGAQFQGNPAPGYSSAQAIEAMEEVVQETLGDNWGMGWTGTAYQESNLGNTATLAIVFGILMVFLILAAQYESWSLPLAVLTATPFAFLGGIGGIVLRGLDTSVYVQIGMLVVVGLAAKNAILIVEFAELQRKELGKSIREAAITAAELRFRPIVMTSLAFIFGTLPLALATGASDVSSHHIGTTVAMGMASVAILGSLFIPSFYAMIASVSDWLYRKRHPNQDLQEQAELGHDNA
ncbi:multidrug efflux RND transporter permease subunit [Vreelandella aquamarina]|uniref:Efflux pump membrane transporter n=2 Tax=Gammaproteobacteria TaxID=1236 RepID=A0A1N6DJ17_9GAMM|nr:efflux RND transporter permease subunit [Halomonas meridiana]GED44582.1 multidrug efflux RND transporter permease subunit [Halomonas meridiana]SIN61654.1 hydrophobic/amphiphilic exporter-1, HAE1 family/multidrug efflux pump [Halomonas meridiana]SIN70782.1 hydrophobic/amphiphilic exporter-1, HAE1 family/multidrug efflux pump [Halomonas meridiana]SIO25015.1 hydrophobic/amphiphilic exporter-1, HAE1 family/multidrug efflux pump [Halomonas meridiana]